MATPMKLKFNKYKEQYSLIVAVVVVFYPRFKMNLVHFYYAKVHGSDACNYVEKVRNTLFDLYNEYAED